MSTTELLPCPFCKGAARFGQCAIEDADDPNAGAEYIECEACSACTALVFPCMESAKPLLAERWNRRASQSQQPAPAEPAWRIAMHELIEIVEARISGGRLTLNAEAQRRLAAARELIAAAAVQPPVVPLTESDFFTLLGHAEFLRADGKTEMPAYFNNLAGRLALAIGRHDLAQRNAEMERAGGIGSVPPSANPDSVHQDRRSGGGVRTDAGGQSGGEAQP